MTEKTDAIWMPLYIDKYLGDTTHLTTEQHGAYLLLLMTAWKRDGLLPKLEQQLQQIARLSPTAWRKHRDVVMAFFVEVEGGYTQKRLAEEFDKASRIIATKRENGKKGGRPRKENLEETDRLTEKKPTGLATDNRQGNRGETQSQLQLQKPVLTQFSGNDDDDTSNSAGAVDVADWQPPDDAIVQLEAETGIPVEFAHEVLIEFREFWTGKRRELPATWTSRFLQRCAEQHARRRKPT